MAKLAGLVRLFRNRDTLLFLYLLCATFYWLASAWGPSKQEFSQIDTLFLAGYVALVAIIQAGIFLALRRFFPDGAMKTVGYSGYALFVVFNLFTILLLHNEWILSLGDLTLVLVAVAAFFVVLLIARAAPTIVVGIVLIATAAGMGIELFQVALNEIKSKRAALVVTDSFPENLVYPEFKQRRNVYLISFDALTPEVLMKKFSGLDKFDYLDALDKYSPQVIRNSFSYENATLGTLNQILSLDNEWFRHLWDKYSLTIGKYPSPVLEVFSRNDYKLQFLYGNSYFGPGGDATIDYYEIADATGICNHVALPIAFAGYCLPVFRTLRAEATGAKDYPQLLFDRIAVSAKTGDNWLTQAHIYSPGHTPTYYDPANEAHVEGYIKYLQEAMQQTALYIDRLVETIQRDDPTAVLLIFGDHGLWVSRGLDPMNDVEGAPYTQVETIQDRHGIYAAIIADDFCDLTRDGPTAISTLIRMVITCLADGEDPLPGSPMTDDWFLPYVYE